MNMYAATLCFAASAAAFSPAQMSSSRIAATALKAATTDEFYTTIDMERRALMNMILLGSATVTVGAIAVPYFAFFVPPSDSSAGGGMIAKDVLGNEILAANYLSSKPAGDRSLVQGLRADPTYLIVNDDSTLDTYALNAICTHLGCVVPWSAADNKFECPCHGSQYSPDGSVVRGPAPLPLELAHRYTDEAGKVFLSPWTENDFRTGETGWWN